MKYILKNNLYLTIITLTLNFFKEKKYRALGIYFEETLYGRMRKYTEC